MASRRQGLKNTSGKWERQGYHRIYSEQDRKAAVTGLDWQVLDDLINQGITEKLSCVVLQGTSSPKILRGK